MLFAALAVLASAAAHSRPLVIEETQWLEAPQSDLRFFAESVAIEGDWALATALRSADGSFNYPYRQLALLYRRSGNQWVFDRVLVDDTTDANSWNDPKVAMKNGIAAVSTSPLRAFLLTNGDWAPLPDPFPAAPANAAWANGLTRIDGRTLAAIAGRCNFGAVTNELSGRTWSGLQTASGNARICSLANYSGSMDVDGNRLVFSNPREDEPYPPTETRIFERTAPGAPWQLASTLPVGEYGYGVALQGDELFVGSFNPLGNDIYRRVGEAWRPAGNLPALDGFNPYYLGATHFGKSDEFILVPTAQLDGLPSGIAIYRRNGSGYQHVAQLASSQGDPLGPTVEISGRTVVVSAQGQDAFDHGRLYFFELPEDLSAPAVIQDDFEDGNAAGWTLQPTALTITRRGASLVLRQPSTSGSAVAVLAASRTTNQSVQVDMRPDAFAQGGGWFGLATRYVDAANQYYVTVRSSGSVQLRREKAGTSVTLASRALPVAADRRYRVRLESIGSRHRVYVNGERVLEAFDREFPSGRVALMASGASVDFDNVVVTPNHLAPLYEAEITDGSNCEEFVHERQLRQSGTPQWDCSNYEAGYLRQASLEGVARAAIGPVTDDQSVETRLQLEDFAEGGTQDKWFGVMTRYTDENNYYYFALRSSKVMSLRKLVDGQIVELGRTGFTLGTGNWHTLKLEAVGNRLRAYVNGQLLMQVADSSHPVGISGIVTYRAAALFDYLRVERP